MPELPEVETIRAQIEKKTPLTILKAEYSTFHNSILKPKSKHFDPVGATISDIKRKGKLLIFLCDDDKYFLSHLGMSGSWRISNNKITEKHTHIQFETIGKNNKRIFLGYVDPRRFGNLYFYHEEEALTFMDGLGIDIGTDEFTGEYVHSVFKKYPNKMVKAFLLDQKYQKGAFQYRLDPTEFYIVDKKNS